MISRDLVGSPLQLFNNRFLCSYPGDDLCIYYGSGVFLLLLSLCGEEKPVGFQIRPE